ncbi:MAG: TIGR00297 family protein, partial [Euryarchaeota archaeon]|nr:TIGR00297 family protein [Euryarchaeota archaeon]
CIAAALVGGVVGFHFDSLLGAVLERRKLISNASVNFLSSITGSLVGLNIVIGF